MFLATPRGQRARGQIQLVGDTILNPVPRGYAVQQLSIAISSARDYDRIEVETAKFSPYSRSVLLGRPPDFDTVKWPTLASRSILPMRREA
jgi:hypothetical protein